MTIGNGQLREVVNSGGLPVCKYLLLGDCIGDR